MGVGRRSGDVGRSAVTASRAPTLARKASPKAHYGRDPSPMRARSSEDRAGSNFSERDIVMQAGGVGRGGEGSEKDVGRSSMTSGGRAVLRRG
jgi:hypothetical protein